MFEWDPPVSEQFGKLLYYDQGNVAKLSTKIGNFIPNNIPYCERKFNN